MTEEDKKNYLLFLRSLLKDRPYVLMAYMTGILPIAKYSSGSELNMFAEFTMITEERFSEVFGFTEAEVDRLFAKYQTLEKKEKVTREKLKNWYDGYHTYGGERVYNPRSVVLSLQNNNLGNYWTSAGPYDEIFSAMVVYGFLSYENGKVCIPNKELMEKFADMLRKEPSFGYVDFIFYPEMDKSADCIILELKVDATPDAAIQQIRDKKYALKFQSNMAGQSKYTGRVLAVGISYDRTGKKHQCKIEVLEEQNNGTD